VVTSKEKSYQIPTVEIPMSSPSMLKMESPAKKRKVNSGQSSNAAPSRQSTASPSTPLKRKQTPTVVIELQAMAPEQRSEYLSIQTSEGKRPSQEDDDEELEDELDFGKGDGEWALPSPDEEEEVSVEPTSHRTGDKDQRSE
jgi:hypothetical protein